MKTAEAGLRVHIKRKGEEMGKTDKSYAELGITKDRYWELVYRVRQYKTLPREDKSIIDDTLKKHAGSFSGAFKRHIIFGIPYKGLDVPYSEAQFKRIKKAIVLDLDEAFKQSAYTYSELVEQFKMSGEQDFSLWLKQSGKRLKRS